MINWQWDRRADRRYLWDGYPRYRKKKVQMVIVKNPGFATGRYPYKYGIQYHQSDTRLEKIAGRSYTERILFLIIPEG